MFVIQRKCTKCDETKNTANMSNVCMDCERESREQQTVDYFERLDNLTIESRIRLIEKQLYDRRGF